MTNDWTTVEKIQLESLVACLPERSARDLEFGVTDTGDPWCAVLNDEGDVVLHVARIEGRFFVHSTLEPYVADARDLPSAVAPFVGDALLQQRHVASVTPLFGAMMPLHAYADPQGPQAAPTADWRHDDAAPAPAQEAVAALPDVVEPWAAPSFQWAEQAPLDDLRAEAIGAAPMDDMAAATLMSSQLINAAAAPAFSLSAVSPDAELTFEPFLRAPDPAASQVAMASLTDGQAPVEATSGPPAPTGLGDNVVAFTPPQAGLTSHVDMADGLVRAAMSPAMVVSDVEAAVIIDWSGPPPAQLMGVLPSVEAY